MADTKSAESVAHKPKRKRRVCERCGYAKLTPGAACDAHVVDYVPRKAKP